MMSVSATFKWNEKTKRQLEQAPEKIMRMIARETMDKSKPFVPSSEGASYTLPIGHRSGQTERSMFEKGVQGDFKSGFYIGNFTKYASYVYPMKGVNWTKATTQTKWFEYTWTKYGKGIFNNAVKANKL